MTPLTQDQKTYIFTNYSTKSNKEIAEHLGCTYGQVKHLGERNKLHKSPATIAKVAAENRKQAPSRRRVKVDGLGAPLPTLHKALKAPKQEKATLTDYLRPLPHNHPDMQAWLRATRPGTPAGSAPRTLTELRSRV